MRVPVYMFVAQWAILLTLCGLVIVMYRQLGHVFHPPKSTADLGPPIGSRAADVEYTRIADGTRHHATPGDGKAMLLAFVDPTCPSCERLVNALETAASGGELADLRALLLVSDPPSYLEISDAFRNTQLEIGQIAAQATVDGYRASATPLLVAIDASGTVRSAGPAVRLSEVRAFRRACLGPPLGSGAISAIPAGLAGESESLTPHGVAGRD